MLLVTKSTQGKNVWQINQFFSRKPSLSRKTKVGAKWLAATEEGDELKRVPVLPPPMPENTTPIGRKNFHAEQNKMYCSKSPAKQHLNPKKEPLPATWKICTSTTKTTRTHVHSSTISTPIFEPAAFSSGKYEPVHVETYSIREQNIRMAKRQKNRHVKKHNLHQDWHILVGQSHWANQRTLFLIQHSIRHWYKTFKHCPNKHHSVTPNSSNWQVPL